jgi:hypothetical protein
MARLEICRLAPRACIYANVLSFRIESSFPLPSQLRQYYIFSFEAKSHVLSMMKNDLGVDLLSPNGYASRCQRLRPN